MLKFSVVIPSDRADTSLEFCLRSIRLQTFPSTLYEVVLVLDGVTASASLLGEIAAIVNKRVYHSPQTLGRAEARNRGIALARAEYIVSLDGDMVASPTLLESYACGILRGKAVQIGRRQYMTSWSTADLTDIADWTAFTGLIDDRADPRDPFYRQTRYLDVAEEPFWAMSTCNCSYPRVSSLEVGAFDSALTEWGLEDQEFGFRLWRAGLGFAYAPDATAIHLEHARSKSAEMIMWLRNRDYCLAKHGEIFGNPIARMSAPILRRLD